MNTEHAQLQKTFYFLAIFVLAGALLYWGRPVVIPVAIAILLTFILAPIVAYLERRGVPRFVASPMAVVGVALLVMGIGHVFALQVRSLAAEIPAYRTQISEKISSLRQATAESWIADVVEFANESVNQPAEKAIHEPNGPPLFGRMEVPLMAVLQSIAGIAVEILVNAVLIMVLTLLMLLRREDLRNRLIHLVGSDNLISATRSMDDGSKRISRFLARQLILNVGFGVVIACGLFLIGIPYAYVWGALAAILRYIPFLGGWIAAAFPLMASLVMPTWTPFFLTAFFFIIVELLQASLVEPLFFGHSIGVSGVSQLIAVLFWGCLWGPVGLIVATPLTACLCVLGRHFSGLHFIATLIGNDEIVEKPAAFYQRLVAGDSAEAATLVEDFIKVQTVPEVYDAVFLPALRSADNDQRHGELSKDDQLAIIESVGEIFQDTVASREAETQTASMEENSATRALALQLPFNDEADELILEMLRSVASPVDIEWSVMNTKDVQSDDAEEPTLIVLATTRERNLVRIRALCKSMRSRFPEAKILAGCWTMENGIDQKSKRLIDAGATAVSTTFQQARQFITSAVAEQGAGSVAQVAN